MSTKKFRQHRAFTRVIISSLLIGLTAAIGASAATGVGFKFIESVNEFFGMPTPAKERVFEKTTAAEPTVTADGLAPEAGELLAWNTFGNLGTETTEQSTINDPNVAATNLTLGTVTAAANGNRFGGSGWFDTGDTNPTTLAESIVDNDYIQFIVTPNSGFSFTPTSFVFVWDRSGTGPSGDGLYDRLQPGSCHIQLGEPRRGHGRKRAEHQFVDAGYADSFDLQGDAVQRGGFDAGYYL